MVDIFCAHCQHCHLDLEGGVAISSSLGLDGGMALLLSWGGGIKKKDVIRGHTLLLYHSILLLAFRTNFRDSSLRLKLRVGLKG